MKPNDQVDADRVIRALAESKRGPLKPKELARTLGVPSNGYRSFKRFLTSLEKAGKIQRVKGHRFIIPESVGLESGIIVLTRAGDGFVRLDSGSKDVFIGARHLNTAMDGDRVLTRIESRRRGRSPEGVVASVLDRARDTIVGTFRYSGRRSSVIPLDQKFIKEIVISSRHSGDADEGDVVVVRLDSYGEGDKSASGRVEVVLGKLTDPGVDVLAVAHGFALSFDFPADVTAAAEKDARQGIADPGAKRVDRTGLCIFTIDPEEAKDHDDALSVVALGQGRFEVGVHIADVSHFIPEAGPVDVEALSRGTSVYLVDRTIPMLPEVLSSDVCSLKSEVERFTLSLFIELDGAGRVYGHRYERACVRSRGQFSYEQVQSVLDGSAGISKAIDEALHTLDDLARSLRKVRSDRGALDLDIPEAKVVLDEKGHPVDIQRSQRLESHRLVEDFMILANEVVAADMETRELSAIYRIHEPPVSESTESLHKLLTRVGYRLPKGRSLEPRDLQQLLDQVRGRPVEALISRVVLRSLSKARYDTRNLSHFGLASPAYLHFTSPIRRYPDLMVHREVIRSLINEEEDIGENLETLQSAAEHSSSREQEAAKAERASVDLKKVEFMEGHLGEEFIGQISGVAAYGFFVTLDTYFVDGLVHVNSLRDDFYLLDRDAHAIIGERGQRRYRIGDRVRVQVSRVDKEARHVDFSLVRKVAWKD
ncbi:MAG: ribonuclease R [Gemmatimonadota bacterium]|nr:ribonuclease R [Gemmatimonadota bacterium]